jgi:hypothetical protein
VQVEVQRDPALDLEQGVDREQARIAGSPRPTAQAQ